SPIVSTTFDDFVRLITTVSGASWAFSETVARLNATAPAIMLFIMFFICFDRASFRGSSARIFRFSSAGDRRWDLPSGFVQLCPAAFVNQMPLLLLPLLHPLTFFSGTVLAHLQLQERSSPEYDPRGKHRLSRSVRNLLSHRQSVCLLQRVAHPLLAVSYWLRPSHPEQSGMVQLLWVPAALGVRARR